MTYRENYQKWLHSKALSLEETSELAAIRNDEREIEARFFAPPEFGTAGLRGVMGAGLRMMNVHTVRLATQAVANVVGSGSVAIAYDCRNNSRKFAEETACVLAANGLSVLMFDELRPTPELSFAVLEYGCAAGINITASHNPKEYNGYKVYWDDGAQIGAEIAYKIAAEMSRIDIFVGVKTMPFDKVNVTYLGADADASFLDLVRCQSIQQKTIRSESDLPIVYTPFHGTGHKLIPRVLAELGFTAIFPVPEQMVIDGNFPTVVSPNPENPEGFAPAVKLADEKDAELIIGSDPDADRVELMIRAKSGEFMPLTGNQTGVLLLDYIITARREAGTMPKNPSFVKSIVTTNMANAICGQNKVAVHETFTGFKNIAEVVNRFAKTERYIFSFEESFGYMCGDHCRDKDAVTAAMLAAEMCSWYAAKNVTLAQALDNLYRKYGYYKEKTLSIVMPGLDGMEKMKKIMEKLRSDPPQSMGGILTTAVRDYMRGERYNLKTLAIDKLEIKGSDVMYFEMENDVSFIVRPSGTEPKMKVYVMAKGATNAECDSKLDHYCSYAKMLIR